MGPRKCIVARAAALCCVVGMPLWAVACAGPASPPPKSAPSPPAAPEPPAVHPVIEAYIDAFGDLLEPEERQKLKDLDLSGTMVGDTQRLRYLAADRAVRTFLPAALEATGDPGLARHAQRMRGLPPVLNADTDAVAYTVVAEALRAKRRYELLTRAGVRPENVGRSPGPTDAQQAETLERLQEGQSTMQAVHEEVVERADEASAREQYADALADYAEAYAQAYGVSQLHADVAAAAAADAADAALILDQAIRAGADREAMIRGGFSLIEEMATAARRRERIPTPKIPPRSVSADDRPLR